MNFQECITFALDNPVCFVASSERGQPRVRGFRLLVADEDGFYFSTLSPKPIFEQLRHNPKIEVCFYNNSSDMQQVGQMRVTGEVEFLDDEVLKRKVAEERAVLEENAGQALEPLIEIFRIHSGEAHFWTMDDILREREIERIVF
jgi:uncharacterized pyridoxamine 5'-phosphate oxidase family protein